MPRATRVTRDRCESCGAALCAEPLWFSVHDGRRTLRTCRPCLEAAWARADAEARWQAQELEHVRTLDAVRRDDGDDSSRRAWEAA